MRRFSTAMEKAYLKSLDQLAERFLAGKKIPEDSFSLAKMKERMRELEASDDLRQTESSEGDD